MSDDTQTTTSDTLPPESSDLDTVTIAKDSATVALLTSIESLANKSDTTPERLYILSNTLRNVLRAVAAAPPTGKEIHFGKVIEVDGSGIAREVPDSLTHATNATFEAIHQTMVEWLNLSTDEYVAQRDALQRNGRSGTLSLLMLLDVLRRFWPLHANRFYALEYTHAAVRKMAAVKLSADETSLSNKQLAMLFVDSLRRQLKEGKNARTTLDLVKQRVFGTKGMPEGDDIVRAVTWLSDEYEEILGEVGNTQLRVIETLERVRHAPIVPYSIDVDAAATSNRPDLDLAKWYAALRLIEEHAKIVADLRSTPPNLHGQDRRRIGEIARQLNFVVYDPSNPLDNPNKVAPTVPYEDPVNQVWTSVHNALQKGMQSALIATGQDSVGLNNVDHATLMRETFRRAALRVITEHASELREIRENLDRLDILRGHGVSARLAVALAELRAADMTLQSAGYLNESLSSRIAATLLEKSQAHLALDKAGVPGSNGVAGRIDLLAKQRDERIGMLRVKEIHALLNEAKVPKGDFMERLRKAATRARAAKDAHDAFDYAKTPKRGLVDRVHHVTQWLARESAENLEAREYNAQVRFFLRGMHLSVQETVGEWQAKDDPAYAVCAEKLEWIRSRLDSVGPFEPTESEVKRWAKKLKLVVQEPGAQGAVAAAVELLEANGWKVDPLRGTFGVATPPAATESESIAAALDVLKSHGWTVTPDGGIAYCFLHEAADVVSSAVERGGSLGSKEHEMTLLRRLAHKHGVTLAQLHSVHVVQTLSTLKPVENAADAKSLPPIGETWVEAERRSIEAAKTLATMCDVASIPSRNDGKALSLSERCLRLVGALERELQAVRIHLAHDGFTRGTPAESVSDVLDLLVETRKERDAERLAQAEILALLESNGFANCGTVASGVRQALAALNEANRDRENKAVAIRDLANEGVKLKKQVACYRSMNHNLDTIVDVAHAKFGVPCPAADPTEVNLIERSHSDVDAKERAAYVATIAKIRHMASLGKHDRTIVQEVRDALAVYGFNDELTVDRVHRMAERLATARADLAKATQSSEFQGPISMDEGYETSRESIDEAKRRAESTPTVGQEADIDPAAVASTYGFTWSGARDAALAITSAKVLARRLGLVVQDPRDPNDASAVRWLREKLQPASFYFDTVDIRQVIESRLPKDIASTSVRSIIDVTYSALASAIHKAGGPATLLSDQLSELLSVYVAFRGLHGRD